MKNPPLQVTKQLSQITQSRFREELSLHQSSNAEDKKIRLGLVDEMQISLQMRELWPFLKDMSDRSCKRRVPSP